MNKIYCSTGTLVGRVCNYDYTLIKKHLPRLYEDGIIDGMEFMMIPFYYDVLDKVISTVIDSGVPSPIIHCEKDVGVLLSDCEDESTRRAFELFKINCEAGEKIGAQKMVFHLWGGPKSDAHVEYNISFLEKFIKIANDFGFKLLIENIPCTTYSGLENWRKIKSFLPQIEFIFDSRFGAFHDEINEILADELWKFVSHIHISDYSSFPRDFSKIRPILHPGEGVVDFDSLFAMLLENSYSGTFTLESPVMIPNGADIEKLKSSLLFIKNYLK